MKRQEQTDLAWFAGIVDGEGCLSVGRNNGKDGKYIGLHLVIKMADRAAVTKVAKLAAVGHLKQQRAVTPNRRPLWKWGASSQEAATVLRKLFPYLVTKRTQARWFLKLAVHLSKRRGRLTLRERAFQDGIVERIKEEKRIR